MAILRLATCTLRPWRADDLESLVRHADNPSVAAHLRDVFPSPYTRADGEAWLALPHPDDRAIEVDGAAVGGIGVRLGADVERLSAEIGYWLGEDYWGRGIVTEAVGAVTREAIEAHGLVRIEARVFANNPASARVLEKNGYVLEGRLRRAVVKRGEVLDVLVYAFVVEDGAR
ncbi:MAG: GNAT family N-acetyltransferase [Dehalococcoidia bacterium]